VKQTQFQSNFVDCWRCL